MKTKIVYEELFSEGKSQENNDDCIYVGTNFAAVIDGVSHKSGKEVKISKIITEAIEKMDRPNAPVYAKTLSFEEAVRFINLYIKEYLQRHDMAEEVGKLEATGVIYSKYYNQVWLVGDCRAIYDGNVIQNPLKIDQVYIDIRVKLIEALLEEGYTQEELIQNDISRDIIKHPELLSKYIKREEIKKQLEYYRAQRIKSALLECGFSEEEIEEQDLITKYYNPRDLQQMLKNNPNMNSFGYAVFNGENTEVKNCKVVTLPDNVKSIKLFSDGFPIDAFEDNNDIGHAVRIIRRRAIIDPLSVRQNRATHVPKRYSKKEKRKAIDDASAIVFRIETDNNKTSTVKQEDELEIR